MALVLDDRQALYSQPSPFRALKILFFYNASQARILDFFLPEVWIEKTQSLS